MSVLLVAVAEPSQLLSTTLPSLEVDHAIPIDLGIIVYYPGIPTIRTTQRVTLKAGRATPMIADSRGTLRLCDTVMPAAVAAGIPAVKTDFLRSAPSQSNAITLESEITRQANLAITRVTATAISPVTTFTPVSKSSVTVPTGVKTNGPEMNMTSMAGTTPLTLRRAVLMVHRPWTARTAAPICVSVGGLWSGSAASTVRIRISLSVFGETQGAVMQKCWR